MQPAIAQDAFTQSYQEVELLIFDTVHSFRRRYGGDFQELLSEARVAFCESYITYDDDYPFSTWVRFKCWTRLLEDRRRRARLYGRPGHPNCPLPLPNHLSHRDFDLCQFLDDLPTDAGIVATMALEAPLDVLLCLKGEFKIKNAHNIRRALHEALVDMGWTASRIADAFETVRDALSPRRAKRR